MGKGNANMPPGMESYSIFIDKAVGLIGSYAGCMVSVDDIGISENLPDGPGANQLIEGKTTIVCSLNEMNGGLLGAVSGFAKESFDDISDEDALDAVGELLNLISGAYAEEMSRSGVRYELLPPSFGESRKEYEAEPVCRLELDAGGRKLCFAVGVIKQA